LDFFLAGEVVVELKTEEILKQKHIAQVIGCLKAGDKSLSACWPISMNIGSKMGFDVSPINLISLGLWDHYFMEVK
jgi:hypothetical protein